MPTPWEFDPAFADVRAVVERLEAAVQAAHRVLLKVADTNPESVVEVFARQQGELLRLDDHAKQLFAAALESKRVKTIAHGNIALACVLTAAVALSEFRELPGSAVPPGPGALLRRALRHVRQHSTHPATLLALSWVSFQAVLARGLLNQWQRRSVPLPKPQPKK